MPRNGAGVYTQPGGTAAVSNTTISSTAYNNLTSDIGNEITNSLPTTGVKAMGANLPMGNNRITGMADPVASSDAATKNYVATAAAPISAVNVFVGGTSTGSANAQVLATTTPNTFTLTAGNRVVFTPGFTNTGAMTLAVNGLAAKNVFTPSGSGPVALIGGEIRASQITEAIYDGVQFVLAAPNPDASFGPLTNLASAATTDLGTIASHNVNVTGTTTITSFGSSASTAFPAYMLTFASALTLTYNATSLILPGGINITTAAGDTAIVLYLGSGNWRVISYQPTISLPGINPTAVARKNLKIITTSVTAGTITADELILENASGAAYRALSVNVSYATGTAGANGLDTGTITASNWYFEWVIYNPTTNTLASLLSLSSTAPTMPSGYTFKARVGASYFDAGSKLRFKVQYDRRAQIVVGTNPTTPLIAASGTSGSPTVPTWTAVAVGSLVPSTAAVVRVALSGFSAGPTTYIIAAPNNSYGAATSSTNPPPLQAAVKNGGEAIGIYSTVQGEFALESTNIYYASAAAGSALVVVGWEDNI